MYGEDYLAHNWITSDNPIKRAAQKKAQDEYNHRYWEEHKDEIMAQRRSTQEVAKGQAYINSQYSSTPGATRNVQRHSTYEQRKQQSRLNQGSKLFPESDTMLKRETALYFNSHPGVSQKEAENAAKRLILQRWYGGQFDKIETDARNQRFNQTLRNQGESVKASELQKRKNEEEARAANARHQKEIIDMITQSNTLKQRSKRDTIASIAQAEAARKRSRIAKNKYAHIQESNAQEKAARNRTIRKSLERSKASAAQRSTNEASAYASARKKQKEYNNSFEGKMTRVVSRAKKRLNKGKKSVQKLLKNLHVMLRK